MAKKYQEVRSILNAFSEVQYNLIDKMLRDMSDEDFDEIPTIVFSDELIKLISNYGLNFPVTRKEHGREQHYYIRVIFPAIFKERRITYE